MVIKDVRFIVYNVFSPKDESKQSSINLGTCKYNVFYKVTKTIAIFSFYSIGSLIYKSFDQRGFSSVFEKRVLNEIMVALKCRLRHLETKNHLKSLVCPFSLRTFAEIHNQHIIPK